MVLLPRGSSGAHERIFTHPGRQLELYSGGDEGAGTPQNWRRALRKFRPPEADVMEKTQRNRRRVAAASSTAEPAPEPEDLESMVPPTRSVSTDKAHAEDAAARHIQAWWRGSLSRRLDYDRFRERERLRMYGCAARWLAPREHLSRLLSRIWRGYAARKAVAERLSRHRAALALQQRWPDIAASRIQRKWRERREHKRKLSNEVLLRHWRVDVLPTVSPRVAQRFPVAIAKQSRFEELLDHIEEEALASSSVATFLTDAIEAPENVSSAVGLFLTSVAEARPSVAEAPPPEARDPSDSEASASLQQEAWDASSDWTVSTPRSDVNDAISDIATSEDGEGDGGGEFALLTLSEVAVTKEAATVPYSPSTVEVQAARTAAAAFVAAAWARRGIFLEAAKELEESSHGEIESDVPQAPSKVYIRTLQHPLEAARKNAEANRRRTPPGFAERGGEKVLDAAAPESESVVAPAPAVQRKDEQCGMVSAAAQLSPDVAAALAERLDRIGTAANTPAASTRSPSPARKKVSRPVAERRPAAGGFRRRRGGMGRVGGPSVGPRRRYLQLLQQAPRGTEEAAPEMEAPPSPQFQAGPPVERNWQSARVAKPVQHEPPRLLPALVPRAPGIQAEAFVPALELKRTGLAAVPQGTVQGPKPAAQQRRTKQEVEVLPWLPMRYALQAAAAEGRRPARKLFT